jgi:hypothetical protein
MKVVSLNEVVKNPLFKPNFDIGFFFSFYSISTTFHDSHAIKVVPHRQMYQELQKS